MEGRMQPEFCEGDERNDKEDVVDKMQKGELLNPSKQSLLVDPGPLCLSNT